MPPKKSKKTSKWITHVKNYSKTHNCSYGEAMTRAKPSYGRGQAGGAWYNDAHKFLKDNSGISKAADWIADKGYAGRHAGTVRKIASAARIFGMGK